MLPEVDRPEDLNAPQEVHKPTKTSRWLNKLTIVALVAIAIGIGIFLMWSFEKTPPLEVKNSPFPTRTIPPIAGNNDVLVLEIDYCKNVDKRGVVRTSYVSEDREIFLPEVEENYIEGCYKRDIPVIIPEDIPPGTYKLKFVATYNLNPLRDEVRVNFQSQEFHISENKNGHEIE